MPRKKPLKYEVDDLVIDLNEKLYAEVSARIEIVLKKRNKGGWSAEIDDEGKAVISYCWSKNPEAAFTHELLHIKAELDGLKDPYIRSKEEGVTWELLRFLVNQLAHHRFYPSFREMGFDDDEFLNDNDENEVRALLSRDVPQLEAIYKKGGVTMRGLAVLLPYLVCISPHDHSVEVASFKDRIERLADPVFIASVKAIMEEWVQSGRMDYCLTLARIFKTCGRPNISFAPQSDKTQEISAASV